MTAITTTEGTTPATTVETAVRHERHRAVREALQLILAGHRHLAYLELCVSLARQARMSGIPVQPYQEGTA